MKKVRITPGCTTCGLCEFIAPEVFSVTDISHVKDNVDLNKNNEAIQQAVKACPVSVIVYEAIKKE